MVENHYKNALGQQEIRTLCEEYLGSRKARVKRDGAAWIVSHGQGDSENKVVLKVIQKGSCIRTAGRMHALHEKVRCMVEGEERSIVRILGHDDESNAIIMEHVDGFPVSKILQRALFSRMRRDEAANAVEKVGEILADINAIEEQDVGIETEGRSNESYVDDLIKISKEIKMGDYLVNGYRDIDEFVNSFPKVWKERSPKHLIAVDVQPKNVFLSESGIVLIDPDYAIGNPAMNIAQVFVSIDMIGLRFPLRSCARIIEEWKKLFFLAYKRSEKAYEWAEDDLAFFYPWALLQSYIRHVNNRPMLAKFFARWYGIRAGIFIERIKKTKVVYPQR